MKKKVEILMTTSNEGGLTKGCAYGILESDNTFIRTLIDLNTGHIYQGIVSRSYFKEIPTDEKSLYEEIYQKWRIKKSFLNSKEWIWTKMGITFLLSLLLIGEVLSLISEPNDASFYVGMLLLTGILFSIYNFILKPIYKQITKK
jgi:hypothetical protein